MQRVHFI